MNVSDSTVRSLWDLESIGICSEESRVPDPVLAEFQGNICVKEGRYQVALPWKRQGGKQLINNERLARKRLDSLESRLARTLELQQAYDVALSEMEADGVIEEVPGDEMGSQHPLYYMHHRPVVRDSSASTKIRPVFEASAPSYNGVSLNDCLETGPSLIPDLTSILIRCGRWQSQLTSQRLSSKSWLDPQIEMFIGSYGTLKAKSEL